MGETMKFEESNYQLYPKHISSMLSQAGLILEEETEQIEQYLYSQEVKEHVF